MPGADPRATELDCIVVGGGPAGLAAAEILHSARARFVVLEAADEIGGRAVSTTLPDGTVFERGAMLLHGARVMTWEAVIKHGMTTHGTYHEDWFTGHVVRDNRWTVESDPEEYEAALEQIGPMLLDPVHIGRSLYDVVHLCSMTDPLKKQVLDGFAGLVPLDPRDIDAVTAGEMLLRESPRTGLFELHEGYSELWRRMSEPFDDKIRLSSPVSSISHRPGRVEVCVGDETLAAAAVIITPSIGVLQSGVIEFAPDLPSVKAEAIAGLRMAPLIKIGARFRSAFWEAAVGDAQSLTIGGAEHVPSWYMPYAKRGGAPLLLALLGAGSESLSGDAEKLSAMVRDDLALAFGEAILSEELVEILIEDWPAAPLALGAGSVAPLGRRHLRQALAAPTPPMFWAGEACSTDGHAECVEGALATGRTAAIEALHSVRPFKASRPDELLDWTKVSE